MGEMIFEKINLKANINLTPSSWLLMSFFSKINSGEVAPSKAQAETQDEAAAAPVAGVKVLWAKVQGGSKGHRGRPKELPMAKV